MLPGHEGPGPTMPASRWTDWAAAAEAAFDELAAIGKSRSSVIGFSTGGTLALYLSSRKPVARQVVMAPFLGHPLHAADPVAAAPPTSGISPRCIPNLPRRPPAVRDPEMRRWAGQTDRFQTFNLHAALSALELIDEVKPLVPAITTPTLILQGRLDTVVEPANATWLYRNLGSSEKTPDQPSAVRPPDRPRPRTGSGHPGVLDFLSATGRPRLKNRLERERQSRRYREYVAVGHRTDGYLPMPSSGRRTYEISIILMNSPAVSSIFIDMVKTRVVLVLAHAGQAGLVGLVWRRARSLSWSSSSSWSSRRKSPSMSESSRRHRVDPAADVLPLLGVVAGLARAVEGELPDLAVELGQLPQTARQQLDDLHALRFRRIGTGPLGPHLDRRVPGSHVLGQPRVLGGRLGNRRLLGPCLDRPSGQVQSSSPGPANRESPSS